MTQDEIVVPCVLSETNVVYCTAPWYVQRSEYDPALCTYVALVNGEETFRAVHLAIAAATRTVDIICWGFQPSMFFIRDGRHPSIGELLRTKARQGVRVRVLGWEMPLNLAGLGGEGNLPGKGALRIKDRAEQNSTPRQYAEDRQWFSDCAVADGNAAGKAEAGHPLFVSRGFSWEERKRISAELEDGSLDREISFKTRQVLKLSATHHQKSVLVDFEVPDRAVGFVMGHNMLDAYWDTDAHSALNRSTHTWPEPNRGPRGFTPRQDISCKLTGEILRDVHHNFATAWLKETGEDLMTAREADKVGKTLQCGPRPWQIAQLLRTQAQTGARDIERAYLQAVNNATQFIYIENQYFRWPPLAEAIKKAAADQTRAGRDPGLHGALHLFVITNATDDGIGAGTVNTQRMLECLGRADAIPNVTKLRRIEKARLAAPPLDPDDRRVSKAHEELQEAIKEIKESTIEPMDFPGLKIHICSLVAQDSPAELPWMPVYIHSKLMIVNDVFTTHGSANINTRSMQVDSELNIAHEWVNVTQALRRKLWGMHTNGMGDQDDAKAAFFNWSKLLAENSARQSFSEEPRIKLGPYAPIVEFYYGKASLKNLD
ncbi:phospholipase [Pseudomonas sp. HR96]|uniref:phospholipase n=1 Tax=Pseudomonas sp. HR96 TaxID=1027966 RepID=UPI002A76390D|nr:phospholipase [Pseudomonas sp. HR96]WPP01099.1 phospholipase [Pseudomonas sp. HR96]